jgi:hypothetical protein
VKNQFQSVPFKRNLQRYTAGPVASVELEDHLPPGLHGYWSTAVHNKWRPAHNKWTQRQRGESTVHKMGKRERRFLFLNVF